MTDNASRSRARWLLVLLALTATLFLVVASACGGDDDDDDGGDNGPTATESSDGGDDGGEETPSDGDDDGGDAAEELAALAGEYEQFEGYVKYEASNFGGTDSTLSSMAIYQKEGYSRVDIESADGNVILITTPDATYMCAEEQCLKYPAGEDAGDAAGAFTQFIDPSVIEDQFGDLPDGVDFDVSEEEIAGVDATCFSASGDLDEDTPATSQARSASQRADCS